MIKIKELREKEKSELIKLLKEARLELVKLRLDRKIGSLTDGSAIDKKRKEIARILTILGEKDVLEEATKTAKMASPPSAKASRGRKVQDAKKKT